jgi:hypothetical protein
MTKCSIKNNINFQFILCHPFKSQFKQSGKLKLGTALHEAQMYLRD